MSENRPMKLQQLRYLCELVANGYNVSRTAAALHTSQPGVSRHIQLLERELGTTLLERQNTRIAGLTRAGEALLPAMQRMLVAAEDLRRQAREIATPGKTKLVIATTHTHARHTLLPALKRFMQSHPHVAIQLRQSSAPRIAETLASGEVDLGVATEPFERPRGISFLPCYRLDHSIVTPPRHALLARRRPTLAQLAPHPIITYDERHRLGQAVREAFAKQGLKPNIAISIIDDDLMKAYVEAGFGVAILPSIAYDRKRDRGLRAVSAAHLFEATACFVMTQEGRHMDGCVNDLIAFIKEAVPRARNSAA